MPNYSWSCFACGVTNPDEQSHCCRCGCPSGPTSNQVRQSRAAHMERGGQLLGEAALREHRDHVSSFDLLVRPLMLLLVGWSPSRGKDR
jgi:hypothetical protein